MRGIALDLGSQSWRRAKAVTFLRINPNGKVPSRRRRLRLVGRAQSWHLAAQSLAIAPAPMIAFARILVDGSCGALANGAEALEF
jgi:hypothetical protein